MSTFHVRPALVQDVGPLAALEQKIYGPLGTDIYDESYFSTWLDVHPAGLIVAEQDGRVVGYHYGQYIDFDEDTIEQMTTYNAHTDDGYTRTTHNPSGRDLHTVSLLSDARGAGRAMTLYLFDHLKQHNKRSMLAASRIAGFDLYAKHVEALRGAPLNEAELYNAAIWYCRETARLIGGSIRENFPLYTGKPLPALSQPDPVLGAYLRYDKGYALRALLTNWMKDPPSRYMGALVIYKNPYHTGYPI